MSLLISKVNNIKVIQVGESRISIENESEDGGKVGTIKKIGFAKNRRNKSIDLGKGNKKHALRLFVFDRSENDALFKIFYEDRYCTIIDKFKGKNKVYIDSVDIIDSDKHIDRTIYEISCTVQDLEKAPSINFEVKLASEANAMLGELPDDVDKLVKTTSSFKYKIDPITNFVEFIDKGLDIVRHGVDSILGVKSKVLENYNSIRARIDTGKRLIKSIKDLKDFPNQFTSLIENIIADETENMYDAKSKSSSNTSPTQKSDILPICEPLVNGKPLSEVDNSKLSGLKKKELEKEIVASHLVNKIKVIKDIGSILLGGFNSQEDFEATVNDIIKRLNFVGYTQDKVSDKIYIVKSFANYQNYRKIVEIEVRNAQPLVRLVFDRYGNLDNYRQIEHLNNFKDNDFITGKIKVFA